MPRATPAAGKLSVGPSVFPDGAGGKLLGARSGLLQGSGSCRADIRGMRICNLE